MEAIIKGVLAQPTLQDNVKSATISRLLASTGTMTAPDASLLLDLGLDLRTNCRTALEIQMGDRILMALSIAHRDLFFASFPTSWFMGIISTTVTSKDYTRNIPLLTAVIKRMKAVAFTEEQKQEVETDMTVLQGFAEKRCVLAGSAEFSVQCMFVAMFISHPETRPLSMSSYVEFLVDHLAASPIAETTSPNTPQSYRNAILLLQQTWENGPDNVYMTIAQLFANLTDDQRECSLGVGHLLQVVPEAYTSVVDPFIQNLASEVLWRLKLTVQRLIDWLVQYDMNGIGVWIVAIMESLASRGEFMLLRELTEQNAYKVARQLAFKGRRKDALLVLKLMLLGYHHSPILFNNISKGLIPLLVTFRKTKEDREFAGEVCNLAQTLVIHFGDSEDIGTKVQRARALLKLPTIPRMEALRTMQDYSWKKSFQIQNTSAGFRRKPAFVQPLGKVGLVNLGNSCFMNSALRALHCSTEFREAILNDTMKVPTSKIMTTRLRETFTSMSTARLAVFTPSILYKALPEWLNDGHQQDAAEFTKILFSRMEDEGAASKKVLESFHGTMVNQIRCGTCGTVSTNKEDFYDLSIPLPRADSAQLQDLVNIFPSVEDLNQENNNMYFCDQCKALSAAQRLTMLGSLPMNLILTLNRFEFDVKRSRRIKVNTPIQLSEQITVKLQQQEGSSESILYDLYAVVIHSGESAHHGHYYTFAKEPDSTPLSSSSLPGTWLLYNDTSVALSSFEALQHQAAAARSSSSSSSSSSSETPYMMFFRKRLSGMQNHSLRQLSLSHL